MNITEKENIKDNIRNITANMLEIEPEEIKDDDLFAEHDMDSVIAMQLIAMLEDKYDIRIPDEKAEKLISIDATSNIVFGIRLAAMLKEKYNIIVTDEQAEQLGALNAPVEEIAERFLK